jgi:hypothetical protein
MSLPRQASNRLKPGFQDIHIQTIFSTFISASDLHAPLATGSTVPAGTFHPEYAMMEVPGSSENIL